MKRIVCLASSRKKSGRCIAGKEWAANGRGQWIRPVSARETQEVSGAERRYEDGTEPALLDIIDVPLVNAVASSFQTENWLLDPKYYWKRVDRLSADDLPNLVDAPDTLWVNGSSTSAGVNDRVLGEATKKVRSSLYLLKVKAATLRVFAPGIDFGNPQRRVQAIFKYRGDEYRLWVTDPKIERAYRAKQDGFYDIGDCYMTVSLGEWFEGYCYKLVAAIICQKL